MKSILKSKVVSVFIICIFLITVAFFGNIISTYAASAPVRVSLHARASVSTMPGYRSSPATGGGTLQWRYLTGYAIISSPAVVDGVVYAGSGDNYVYALNAGSGGLLWRYQTGDHVFSSPAVVSGIVYIGSDDGNVYALTA